MLSLSSNILSATTTFRNPNGPEQEWIKKINNPTRNSPHLAKLLVAELGYIVTIPLAITETALSAIAALFSNEENKAEMKSWFYSSAFSIIWSVGDALINPICNDLIVTEKVAKACAASWDIFNIPVEAL